MPFVTHKDDENLATGTHAGADSAAALYDKTAMFDVCGVAVGLAIHNETQVTDGLVTVVTATTVTDDTNTWDNGDTYSIYKTAEKDTVISTIATDKSRGWKVTDPDKLNSNGWFPEDEDIDVDEDGDQLDPRPWGPGQPEVNHG